MSRWPESARFWIVIGCINIAIPAFTIWKMHTDDLGRVAALYTCWVSFVLLNAVCLLGMWSRERRAGRFGSRMRTVQGIAFALIAAIATTFAINSYAARNSYF